MKMLFFKTVLTKQMARMILAQDAQVLVGKSNILFQGFIGIKKNNLKIYEMLISLRAKRAGPVLRNVTLISFQIETNFQIF